MHRYFTNDKKEGLFKLENDNHHHLKNVVKLNVGEEIVCIFNNKSYLSQIVEITSEFTLVKELKLISEDFSSVKTTLIVGIIREQKWDFVLQKASELGVDIIVPVEFKRNVVKIDPKKEDKKIERWTKICEDASEQSYRSSVPMIQPIVRNLNDLKKYKSDVNLTAWEEEKAKTFKEYIKSEFNSISFVVGPEGGIDPKEIKILNDIGFEVVTLGKRILRAETVPLMFMSSIIFEKEI